MMKAYMLMTAPGPIVILTSHASILDDALIKKLAKRDIEKFVAYEIPIGLAEQRYGAQFSAARGDLRETDDLSRLELKILSPDETQPQLDGLSLHGSAIEFTVRRIDHYSVVTLSERAGP